ncbi:MAG TPA: septal ring lytic transglycosylase RlpA family protein [Gammaproteobacteria bacterium]|nr:septal ring lytic transglycosylase RlpA family protein [Gammaproteobacteria bacterium]
MTDRLIHGPAALTLVLLLAGLALSGCGVTGGPGDGPGRTIENPQAIPNAKPRAEPRSASGNPASYEVNGRRYHVRDSARGFVQRGIASWYGSKFHGKRTSSGEPYNMYAMTAAHKTLPLPTYVSVTNLDNGRRVVVKVNDRGPFARNRIIDLSYAAAAKLHMIGHGTAPVEIRAITPGQGGGTEAKAEPMPDANPTPAARTAPATEHPTSRTVDYYVQVGAFSKRDNAYRMAGRVEAAKLDARVHVRKGPSDLGTVYRVQVGPLSDADSVDAVTRRLETVGVSKTQVVVAE